jgi:hypothetical protein
MNCSGQLVENCIVLGVFGGLIALMTFVLIMWTCYQTSYTQNSTNDGTQAEQNFTQDKVVVVVDNPISVATAATTATFGEDPKN